MGFLHFGFDNILASGRNDKQDLKGLLGGCFAVRRRTPRNDKQTSNPIRSPLSPPTLPTHPLLDFTNVCYNKTNPLWQQSDS